MSNTRPPLARQHTRSTEAKRSEELDTGYRFTIDGDVFEARFGDVTPLIARELRANIGMGFMSLLGSLGRDPDIDLVSAAVWVARRIRGEHVAFTDVEVSYAQMFADGFRVDMAGAEDVEPGPEA